MARKKPKHQDVWRTFAAGNGGSIVETSRGRVKGIDFPHRAWTITLDTYSHSTGEYSETHSRLRARFPTLHDFHFRITPEHLLARIGKSLGMRDIHTGQPELDRRFIVRGNNESLVRSLFIDPAVYGPLLREKPAAFALGPQRGKLGTRIDGMAELRFHTSGAVADPERLASMLALMRGALDCLARIGVLRTT